MKWPMDMMYTSSSLGRAFLVVRFFLPCLLFLRAALTHSLITRASSVGEDVESGTAFMLPG